MGLSTGTRLGPYEILAPLGAGGMGEVYRARDTRLSRDVAIKILRTDITQDRERLVREARSASALNHPNIVALYDIGEADGADFLVMELVTGQSLEREIPRRGMRLAEALRISVQIADALAAAHSAGITHRDLKPSNVMVTGTGQVKLLDFGLAQLRAVPAAAAAGVTAGSTSDGTIAGTLSYMSPEQAEGKRLDGRSDIFSFGAVLYEMLTGEKAFHGDSPAATLSSVLRDEPKQLKASNGEVPREVERLLARCLRKDPERRFQSAADLRVSLQELKEESDSGRLTAATVAVARRPPLKVAYGVVVAIAVIAAAGAAWWKLHQPEPAMPTDAVIRPLTAFPGVEEQPALSPDGKQVAFSWKGETDDNWDVYLMQTGGGKPLRLTTAAEPDRHPAWSPDGQKIAFVRLGVPTKVIVVPSLGGPERVVTTIGGGDEIAWSQNGQEIFLHDSSAPTTTSNGILAVDINTGQRTPLTRPPAGSLDRSPAISPDGRTLAFVRRITTSNGNIYVAPLDASGRPQGEPRLLKQFIAYVGALAWAPDGQSLVFETGSFSNGVIMRLYLDGRVATLPLGQNTGNPSIASHGNALAYNQKSFDPNVLAFEAGHESPRRVANSTAIDLSASYSPDGKKLALMSTRSGNYEVWASNSDGTNAVQLTAIGKHLGGPAWSPDGTTVAFDSVRDGHWHIYTVPAEGGAARQLTFGDSTDVRATWAADGKWVFFGSDRGGGWAIWKVNAAGGEAVRATQSGTEAFATPDGKWLYYGRQNESGVWRTPAAGGAEEKVLDQPRLSLWGICGQGIYYLEFGQDRAATVGSIGLNVNRGASPPTVQFYSFETRKTTRFLTLPANISVYTAGGRAFAVSPDGKTILLSVVENEQGDLYIVDNFR